MLAEAKTVYVINIDLALADNTIPAGQKVVTTVMNICVPYHDLGYHLYMYNWYTSFGLCVRLWDRSWQCCGITVGMETRTILVDCADDFDNATLQRFFTSVRKFYVFVVEKMARVFPFNDEALKDLTVLNPDPKLRDSWNPETVCSLAIRFSIVAADDLDALVVEFQDYQLSAEHELPVYASDTRTDSFWAVARLKIGLSSARELFIIGNIKEFEST